MTSRLSIIILVFDGQPLLERGEMKRARTFLQNKHDPQRRSFSLPLRTNGSFNRSTAVVAGAQELLHLLGSLFRGLSGNLPAAIGAPMYRAVRRVRHY